MNNMINIFIFIIRIRQSEDININKETNPINNLDIVKIRNIYL